ncbi:spore coat protein CotJB [Thermoanaerobacterium sp. DL9XJH110]|jgi:spore coat protein JB|uniref:spore coat protein CotJB n=1 Tax=Thermoanaerobacterium sp. DL9XJH110 TaxID=3386643 RepID=UPI003BB7573C
MQIPEMINLLTEIQAVDFAVYELALFLDTHPDDRRALEDHSRLARRSHQLKAIYEERFGPLKLDSISQYPYQYISDPWPWEIRY